MDPNFIISLAGLKLLSLGIASTECKSIRIKDQYKDEKDPGGSQFLDFISGKWI